MGGREAVYLIRDRGLGPELLEVSVLSVREPEVAGLVVELDVVQDVESAAKEIFD